MTVCAVSRCDQCIGGEDDVCLCALAPPVYLSPSTPLVNDRVHGIGVRQRQPLIIEMLGIHVHQQRQLDAKCPPPSPQNQYLPNNLIPP